MTPLCLNGKSSSSGTRSSARRWFSQVTLKKIFSHPSPHPSGRHARTLCGRLVSRKNFTSLLCRMISHASARHGSACSKRNPTSCTPEAFRRCAPYSRRSVPFAADMKSRFSFDRYPRRSDRAIRSRKYI